MGFFTSSKKANGAASAQDAELVQALNMAHGIVWFDLSATVIDANPKFCDMLGVERDSVLAKPHDSFLDASVTDDLRASQLFATLKTGTPVAATVKWRIPGSDQLWVQSSYLPIKEASGEVCKIALIATDVTATNSTTRDHLSEYDSVQQALSRVVFDAQGNILEANDAFLAAMEYERADVIGQNHSVLVKPEYANSEEYNTFWQTLVNGEAQSGAFSRLSKTGAERWFQAVYCPTFDDDGTLKNIVKLASDITCQSKAAKYASRASDTQAVVEFNLDGKIQSANNAFLQLMGYTLEDVVGKHHSIFMPEYDADRTEYDDHWATLQRGEILSGQYRRRHKSGQDVWILAIYKPAFGPDGKPMRVVKYATDITPRIRAVTALREGLEHLAEGDVSKPINDAFSMEFEPLRADFNSALDRLRNSIETVVQAARRIGEGTQEINGAANDLSRRTENQAAALEQTAAAINEMTASVKSTAQIAQHTNGLAGRAKSHASSGTGVMKQARNAMDAIAASSNEVSKVTSVIEDIAFQTNLLALNAGVEAARAGEAGRGFAVVASEVRALAQRSSEAATQISQLIASSVAQVEQGVDLVSRTSEALSEIEGFVGEVADLVGDITIASKEQSGGISEIMTSISSLEEVTRMNAAIVVETNAATKILTTEAQLLNDLTSTFVLNDDVPSDANAHPTDLRAVS